jgi:hypothetical protein
LLIVEVETALTLVAPSGYTRMAHQGYNVTRLNDLVYIFNGTEDPRAGDATGPDELRVELNQDSPALVQIFAGGRRCAHRRVVDNGADMPDGIE